MLHPHPRAEKYVQPIDLKRKNLSVNQVYRVYLPREILAERWQQLSEEANRQTGLDGIKKLLAALERNPKTQEIVPLLADIQIASETA